MSFTTYALRRRRDQVDERVSTWRQQYGDSRVHGCACDLGTKEGRQVQLRVGGRAS